MEKLNCTQRHPDQCVRFRLRAARTTFALAITALAAILPSFSLAQNAKSTAAKGKPSYVINGPELFKKYKPAVAKITLKQFGIPVSVGAGFFISADGLLVTNYHVVRNAIMNEGFSAEFTLGDKRVIKDFRVNGCGDHRGMDLCVLKLDVKPKIHFKIAQERPEEDHFVYAIGHPRGLDFTLTTGTVAQFSKSPSDTEEIHVKAELLPGNSGGPIFDEQGQIVGVVTRYSASSSAANTNTSYGIASSELSDYLIAHKETSDLDEARYAIDDRLGSQMLEHFESSFKPALNLAKQFKPIENVKGFKARDFSFGDESLKIDLPTSFGTCKRTDSKDSIVHACFAQNDGVVFTVQRSARKDQGGLLKKHGKPLLEPKPLATTQALIHEGVWPDAAKKFDSETKALFYSQPAKAECQLVRRNILTGALFSETPACRFRVDGDVEAGAHSANIWIEKGPYLYGFAVWMNENAFTEYYGQVPTLAVLTARKNAPVALPRVLASELSQERLESYEFVLPSTHGFIGSKVVKGTGAQFDFYGKKRLTTFDDSYLLVVSSAKEELLPPAFDGFTREMVLKAAKEMGLSLRAKPMDFEAISAAGVPGRLGTLFGKDKKGADILVNAVTLFGPDRVHLLLQVTETKDPDVNLKLFKSLLAGFKRK